MDELGARENNSFPVNIHAMYIQPPDNDDELSGEDDAGDDSGGIPDNVCGGQLRAGCELVFADGRRISQDEMYNIFDDGNDMEITHIHDEQVLVDILNAPIEFDDQLINSEEPSTSIHEPLPAKRLRRVRSISSGVSLPQRNKDTKFTWKKDDSSALMPVFPPPNYEDCKGLKAHEQFEKFFDDVLLQHICDCSAVYASFKGRANPNITVDGIGSILCNFILMFRLKYCYSFYRTTNFHRNFDR